MKSNQKYGCRCHTSVENSLLNTTQRQKERVFHEVCILLLKTEIYRHLLLSIQCLVKWSNSRWKSSSKCRKIFNVFDHFVDTRNYRVTIPFSFWKQKMQISHIFFALYLIYNFSIPPALSRCTKIQVFR